MKALAFPMNVLSRLLLLVICLTLVITSVRGENLYVVVSSAAQVATFDVSNLQAIGAQTLFASGSNFAPQFAAFDTIGDLYLGSFGNGVVPIWGPSGGSSIGFISSSLSGPSGVAFGAGGLLYVSNSNNDTISVFTPQAPSAGTPNPAFIISGDMANPGGIAIDSEGNLNVANIINPASGNPLANTVSRFDSTGTFLGSLTHASLNRPADTAFDSAGNLYVANLNGNNVSVFDSSLNYLASIGSSSNLNAPHGLAIDSLGNLFVSNAGANSIAVFDLAGIYQTTFAVSGTPIGLAFVPEPSTFLLLGLGLGLAGLWRWKKGRALS